VEEVPGQRLVQRDAVLVIPIQPGRRVLIDMLGQRDRGQQSQRVFVDGIETRLQGIQKVLGVIGVALADQFQVRVDESGPQELPQLKLDGFESAIANVGQGKRPHLINVEVILDPVSQQQEGLEILLRTRVLASLGGSAIGTQIGCLLSKDSFRLGEAFLFQIVGDLGISVGE
jgi:hypothetical protein